MRQYMAARIGGTQTSPGQVLCGDQGACLTSQSDTSGETKIIYSDGIRDYIGISSYDHPSINGSSTQYIGVVRNEPGDGTLRCFATYQAPCTAPPNSYTMPEGVPYQLSVPIVSSSALASATNQDDNGSPSDPIPGALIVTPAGNGNFWNFSVNEMDTSTCAQQIGAAKYGEYTDIAYVRGYDFKGGTATGSTAMGVQDAVIVEAIGYGNGATPAHIERYFYVQGWGRAAEGVAYLGSDGKYDSNSFPRFLRVWHNILPRVNPVTGETRVPFTTPVCQQGSAVSLVGN